MVGYRLGNKALSIIFWICYRLWARHVNRLRTCSGDHRQKFGVSGLSERAMAALEGGERLSVDAHEDPG